MPRARSPENTPPAESDKQLIVQEMAEHAARLMVETKCRETDAIGRVLDQRTILDSETRRRYFSKIISVLRRAGADNLYDDYLRRVRANAARTPEAQARAHWAEEARRAGFEDIDDFLAHLNR